MATRREDAPALCSESRGDRSGSSILSNMPAPARSATRSPSGSTQAFDRRADQRDARDHELPDRAGAHPQGAGAGQRDRSARQRDRPRQFPVPKFWPGDGGRYIAPATSLDGRAETGRLNVELLSADAARTRRSGLLLAGKHGLPPARPGGERGEPCEVVCRYGIDPVLFMLAAQVFGAKESELDVPGIMDARWNWTEANACASPSPQCRCW